MTALAASYLGAPSGAVALGPHDPGSELAMEVVLDPSHTSRMQAELAAMYDEGGPEFHKWLAAGQFDERFAPSAQAVTAVKSFLRSHGLTVVHSSSPFLVAATGSTARAEAAFATGIEDYEGAGGKAFFTNDEPVEVPDYLAADVAGVVGLDDTSSPESLLARQPAGGAAPHYGDGPFDSGLVPTQTRSLYGAGKLFRTGVDGQGHGVVSAVFELSAYARSDVEYWWHYFYGRDYEADIVNVDVDGGSIHPKCPKGDHCKKGPDYSGDDEVTADIEQQLTVAPDLKKLLVYDAPNDRSGETTIDEYMRIASDDEASTISTSWGLCEQDIGAGVARAENVAFTQMAMQGQSIFAAAGDNGAYDCLEDGTSNVDKVAVDDPGSQPWMTSVGGTSFSGYDPGSDPDPQYPAGVESVWNPLDQCSGTAQGLKACVKYGAGGGGVSVFWTRPSFQSGPGVTNSDSRKAPACAFASKGQYCREVPDVSADADEYTPYAGYCKGIKGTNSSCRYYLKFFPSGWSGSGGTSLSSPLWAALVADAVSYHGGRRFGDADEDLYALFRSGSSEYFHDVTGVDQTDNNNGLYPTTPNFDLATGIGTPDISAIAMAAYRS